MGKKVIASMTEAQELITALIYGEIMNPSVKAPIVLVEGMAGIGKSAIPAQVIQRLCNLLGTPTSDWGNINLKLATRTCTDIQGIPFPGKEENVDVVKWLKDPSILPGVVKSKTCPYGILFLDEFNQIIDDSVKSLSYELLNEYRMGEYSLPKGWFMIAAGNRLEDGGVYDRLKGPVRDRLLIIEIRVTKDEWVDWARAHKLHYAVTGLVDESRSENEVLHTYDAKAEELGDVSGYNYVFSTPRSLEKASEILYLYEKNYKYEGKPLMSSKVLKLALQGELGDSVGEKLYNYYSVTKDLNLDDIMSINWNNGIADKQLSTPKTSTISYYISEASYPTEETLEKSYRIVMYLSSTSMNNQGLTSILNTYTREQRAGYEKYLTKYNSNSLYNNVKTIMESADEAYSEK